ncbi:MAG: VWA domain-containing protein [Planctomycetes bacterium]|nr:VWA domain-containing protein [Planctomycetota bacterium]
MAYTRRFPGGLACTALLAALACGALAEPPAAPTWEEDLAKAKVILDGPPADAGAALQAVRSLTRWAGTHPGDLLDFALPVLARHSDPNLPGVVANLIRVMRAPEPVGRLLEAAREGNATLRRNLFPGLVTNEAPAIAEALGALLDRETEDDLRGILCDALALRKPPGALDRILVLVREAESPAARASAIGALGAIGSAANGGDLLPFLASRWRSRGEGVSCAALDALVRLEIPLERSAVAPFLRSDASFEDALAGTRAVVLLPVEDRLDLLRGLPREDAWQIRLAGVGVLGVTPDRGAVDLLLEMLDREKERRVSGEIVAALERLTHVHFNPDRAADSWPPYWRANRETFVFPEGPAPGGAPEGAAGGVQTVSTFYGLPVDTDRPVFVIDISGSMSASQGAAAREGKNRLDIAKEQLRAVVQALPRDAVFNLVVFESGVRAWRPGMTPATPENKATCLAFIAALTPMGATNLMGGLDEAFGITSARIADGRGQPDYTVSGREASSLPDTVYLLSDGAPSAGRVTDPAGILREVARLNRSRGIRIHSLSIGADSPFLRDLSSANHGTFRHIAD